MSTVTKIKVQGENLLTTPLEGSFTLLSSILFLTQTIKKEELNDKAKELLREIKKILQSKSLLPKEELYKNYTNINEEDITLSPLYIPELDKTYYYLEKAVRINFTSKAKLYEYSNYIQDVYSVNRREYLLNKNKIIDLVKDIENEVVEEKCQEAKDIIRKQEILENNNFLYNLLGDLEKDFILPIGLITEIIKINIILLEKIEKDTKVIDIQEINKTYKYLIIMKNNDKYQPVYIKGRKEFNIQEPLIMTLINVYQKENREPQMAKLSDLMADIEPGDKSIKGFVDSLDLEEA